jgi:hypothetical protein
VEYLKNPFPYYSTRHDVSILPNNSSGGKIPWHIYLGSPGTIGVGACGRVVSPQRCVVGLELLSVRSSKDLLGGVEVVFSLSDGCPMECTLRR